MAKGKKSDGSGKGQKQSGADDFFSAKNLPILIVCLVMAGGLLLAMTPAPRSSRGGGPGQGPDGSGGEKKQTLQDAVEAIHKARDLPEFTAEVLLSVMSRFYSVYLGGPIPRAVQAHAQTEEGKASQGWAVARPNAFKAFAFAFDAPAPSKAKGKAHAEALQRQVITEAHIHMLARAGDKVFVDQSSGFGEDIAERCKVLSSYGLECVAWTEANDEAVNAELKTYVPVKAAAEGAEGEAGNAADADAEAQAQADGPKATVFVVATPQRLASLGVVNADPNGPDAKPIAKVLHVLFAGPPQTKEQREQLQREMAAREQFEQTPNAAAAGDAAAPAEPAAPAADA